MFHSRNSSIFYCAPVALLCIGLTACSVHPLPADVSRPSTVDLVKTLRCEALAGIDSLRPEEKLRAAPVIQATVIGYDFTFTIRETDDANGGDPNDHLLSFINGSKVTLDLTGSASLQRGNE